MRSDEAVQRGYAAKKKVKAAKRLVLQAYKVDKGCIDCGYNADARALDFDHRDPTTKEFNVMQFMDLRPSRVWAEVEKCDVRCANCHRIKTYDKREHLK